MSAAPVRLGPNRELAPDGLVLGGFSMSVTDLDRSLAFYRALGFEVGEVFTIQPPYGPLLGQVEGFTARGAYMRRDGIPIELVQFLTAPVVSPPSPDLGRQLGFAHMRLGVRSLREVEARIRAHGGSVLEDRRTTGNGMDYVYCADPDGVRILLSAPASS